MDLRPINPFYKVDNARSTWTLRTSTSTYSYPYTWIEPVTDRTESDVAYAKTLCSLGWENMTVGQQEEFLAGLKGCMNRADFERIENNVQILLDVFEIDSKSYVDDVPEFLAQSYFKQLQSNVGLIREAFFIHTDTPTVPELPYNTWQKYNDIEKILADVYETVSAQFHYYAGEEIYAGDDSGLLL